MVRSYNWYDAMLTRKLRRILTVLIWIAWLSIMLLQYENIIRFFSALKRSL